MDRAESPPSPSYTVSSPRRTLSLLRKRRHKHAEASEGWDGEERKDALFATGGVCGGQGLAGPKPSEVYGFVGAITTVVATGVFLAWAYTPQQWLHWLGITYSPSKYWAVALPTYAMVVVVLAMVFYLAMNFMITPPPTSFNSIFGKMHLAHWSPFSDEYSREPLQNVSSKEDAGRAIEPISDIGINHVNDIMFGKAAQS